MERTSNKDIATSWNQYLRQRNKAQAERLAKPRADSDKPISEELRKTSFVSFTVSSGDVSPSRKKPSGHNPASAYEDHKSLGSNPSSLKREGFRSKSDSPPKRSKATSLLPIDESHAESSRDVSQGTGRLWSPNDDASASPTRPALNDEANVAANNRTPVPPGPRPRPRHSAHQPSAPPPDEDLTPLIKQPETRPISQEQLVAEVKGIYAGLVMVENKCIEADNAKKQQNPDSKLNKEQWQALIALHRALLHEHHDFFLASQHPTASPALRRFASKYAMPARIWRHGIHSFLELRRPRRSASLNHMLTFIYLAYSMMALMYETVPALEDTWIECLRDLGQYRMAIEDDDIRKCCLDDEWAYLCIVREHTTSKSRAVKLRKEWQGTSSSASRNYYTAENVWADDKAPDKVPTAGGLYHHLAILAYPSALQHAFTDNERHFVLTALLRGESTIARLHTRLHRVPVGYSLKNWDPNQDHAKPLVNAFEDDPPGKWISDWSVVHRMPVDPNPNMACMPSQFPWKSMSWSPNTLLPSCLARDTLLRPAPEDNYHRSWWFSHDNIEDFERFYEALPVKEKQKARVLDRPGGQPQIWTFESQRCRSHQHRHSALGQPDHGYLRRARFGDGTRLELLTPEDAIGVYFSNRPSSASAKGTSHQILSNFRPSALSRLLRLFAPLFMFSLSLALTASGPRVPWYIPKMLLLSTSALGSFTTGAWCLNLDMASPSGGTQPADMGLRVVSSVLVGILFVGYVFWFIGQRTKRAQFKRAQFKIATSFVIVLWVVVRLLRGSNGDEKSERAGGDYLWLDELNLLACASVVAGIANAERSIFSSAESERGEEDDEDGLLNSRQDDIESQRGNDRREDDSNGSATGSSAMEGATTALQVAAGI